MFECESKEDADGFAGRPGRKAPSPVEQGQGVARRHPSSRFLKSLDWGRRRGARKRGVAALTMLPHGRTLSWGRSFNLQQNRRKATTHVSLLPVGSTRIGGSAQISRTCEVDGSGPNSSRRRAPNRPSSSLDSSTGSSTWPHAFFRRRHRMAAATPTPTIPAATSRPTVNAEIPWPDGSINRVQAFVLKS